jgi:NADPH:quinone reductase-like Zn-dependent oxidoreductase
MGGEVACWMTPRAPRSVSPIAAEEIIAPVIERTYALSEAPEAIRHLEEGRARGKLVITV